MTKLFLCFISPSNPELFSTCFRHPLLAEERRCLRGTVVWDRAPDAQLRYEGAFQWTAAVKAFSLLALRTAASDLGADQGPGASLIGGRNSAAASFDYALCKQPAWLLDVFGVDRAGLSIASRLFLRHIRALKRPGPVIISFNPRVVPAESIDVYMNSERITDPARLQAMADGIEYEGWRESEAVPAACFAPYPAMMRQVA